MSILCLTTWPSLTSRCQPFTSSVCSLLSHCFLSNSPYLPEDTRLRVCAAGPSCSGCLRPLRPPRPPVGLARLLGRPRTTVRGRAFPRPRSPRPRLPRPRPRPRPLPPDARCRLPRFVPGLRAIAVSDPPSPLSSSSSPPLAVLLLRGGCLAGFSVTWIVCVCPLRRFDERRLGLRFFLGDDACHLPPFFLSCTQLICET